MFDVGSHEILQTKDGLCLDFVNRKRFKEGRIRYILKKEYTLFGKNTIIPTATQI